VVAEILKDAKVIDVSSLSRVAVFERLM